MMKRLALMTAFFCSAVAAAVHNPYGTTSHLTRTGYADREAICAKYGAAGAKWMRMDFDWYRLWKKGKWDFSWYDDILVAAETNGVQVVGILGGPPREATPVWEHLEEWRTFVRTVADHYRGRLPVYEVWNEEDAEGFWHAPPNATNYFATLKVAYEALKASDPSIRVALGSLTCGGRPFGEQLYRLGAAKYFDLMNVHPYPVYHRAGDARPEGDLDVWLRELREMMAKYGDGDKEIWITEIGWPTPHELTLKPSGLLKDGLKVVDPGRKAWKTLVADPAFNYPVGPGEKILAMVRRELPPGSTVVGTTFEDLGKAMAADRPDLLVISPCSQVYPAEHDRAIVAYGQSGGVIAEFGGMPFYEGVKGKKGTMGGWQLRRALHFDSFNWWNREEPRMPKHIAVWPTAAAPSVKPPTQGFDGMRFVTDKFLRPGDTMTPLLSATWTNGAPCVAAAAIRYAKGGGLVFGGLMTEPFGVFSELEQAMYVPRTHLIAFDAGVETLMWYELRSHDFDRHDGGWGMLHVDLTEKLAWKAFCALTARRPAGSVQLPSPPRTGDCPLWRSAWRRPDGRTCVACWTAGGECALPDDLPASARFYDLYGKELPREKVRVTPLTVYCEFESQARVPDADCPRKVVTTAQGVVAERRTAAGRPVFDFGKDAFGWLEIESAAGGDYELVLGELCDGTGAVTNRFRGSTIRAVRAKGVAAAGRFRVPLVADRRNTTGPKGSPAILLPADLGVVMPFRYVEAAKLPAGAKLVRQMVHYPMDMAQSSFDSDCEALNRVYEFCKYSILATSFAGLYVDGDRERIPYEADAYVNQLDHYAIEADYALARKTHEYLMRVPTWPTEWKQHSVKMAWADWMWTGDVRSLERNYDRLVREKLLGTFRRRDIVDWPLAERDGFVMTNDNSVVDAFDCRNREEMADIAAALGKAEDAGRFRREAAERKAAFRTKYLRADGLVRDTTGDDHSSLHANAAALAFGLVPDEHVKAVVAHMDAKGMATSVYFAQYVLEAYCRAGRADLALKYMTATGERSWLGMLDFGSTVTMEAWNMKAKPNQDLNHAWGAAPLNVISRFILGVTPEEPGFRKIRIAPQAGGLRRVTATVPTARGPVRLEIREKALKVSAPAPAVVVWNGKSHEVAAGEHTFF